LRKVVLGLIVVLFVFALSGCGVVRVNPDRDREQVVATFNDGEILKGEVIDRFDSMKLQMGITEEMENDPAQSESILMAKGQILDSMIDERITEKKAYEAGFTVRDEDIAEAQANFDEQLLNYADFLREQDDEAAREGVDYVERAREVFNTELERMGFTEEAYIETVALQTMLQEFRESLVSDVVADAEQVQNYYDMQLELQRTSPNPVGQDDIPLIRDASARVKHILISLPEEDQTEYRRLRTEGLNDDADTYLAERLELIRPQAQAILDRANAGEDFELLIETYGEDPGMIDNEEGYTVTAGGGFIPEFEEASLALTEIGQISDLVGGQFGFHIIRLYEQTPEHTYTFEEVREQIQELLNGRMRSTRLNELLATWREEANIVRFTDRL